MIDETGFLLQPLLRRTWAPRGQTPESFAWNRHDRLTAISALTLSPQRQRITLHLQLLTHNARWHDFVQFLQRLRQDVRHPLVVIWDALSAHRKADRFLQDLGCDWLKFEYLPPYAPELNPVEHVWSTTKWGDLPNRAADDLDALRDDILNSCVDHVMNQQLLRSHFDWAGLKL